MFKKVAMGAVALALVSASAYAAKPADVIKARQDNFKVIGKSFKAINDELRKPSQDVALIQANAKAIGDAAKKVGGHFPKGSGPEAGVKTDALPEIWSKPADFKAALAKLGAGSAKLQAAAKTGDVGAIKAAIPAIGGSCKSCHDQFKAKN
jgi:cytochrome c556